TAVFLEELQPAKDKTKTARQAREYWSFILVFPGYHLTNEGSGRFTQKRVKKVLGLSRKLRFPFLHFRLKRFRQIIGQQHGSVPGSHIIQAIGNGMVARMIKNVLGTPDGKG